MTDLKPCPFCGGEVKIEGGAHKSIFCIRCRTFDFYDADTERMARKWNTRHYHAEVQQAVERMKPMKPERRLDGWNCPICEMFQTHEWEVDQPPFCWNCGQALDWEVL